MGISGCLKSTLYAKKKIMGIVHNVHGRPLRSRINYVRS